MVSHRERPRKDGAGFSVLSLAVTEKQGIGGAVTVSKAASLADETALYGGVVGHMGTATDYEVVCDNPVGNGDGSVGIAVDGTVSEPAGAAYNGMVTNAYSVDMTRVTDRDIVPYPSALRRLGSRVFVYHLIEAFYKCGPVTVHCKHIGNLGAKAVIDLHLAAAGFIEDGHLHAVSKCRGPLIHNEVYVLNVSVGADVVVGNVVGDVLHKGFVPHRNIVKRAVPEAGMLLHASGKDKHLRELAKTHCSGKADSADVLEGVRITAINRAPVFCAAATLLEQFYLFCRKFTKFHLSNLLSLYLY